MSVECYEQSASNIIRISVSGSSSGIYLSATPGGVIDSSSGTYKSFTAHVTVTLPLGAKPGLYACVMYGRDILNNYTSGGSYAIWLSASFMVTRTGGIYDDQMPRMDSLSFDQASVETELLPHKLVFHYLPVTLVEFLV